MEPPTQGIDRDQDDPANADVRQLGENLAQGSLTDAQGRIAAFLTTPQRPLARLIEVSRCPGGKLIAERWTDQVTVRDLSTFETIRAEPLPPPSGALVDYGGLVCRNNDGSEVLVARKFATSELTQLFTDFVEIARPAAPLIEGRFTSVDILDPGNALVTAKFANTRLELLDLKTGKSRLIDEARDIEEAVRFPARIGGYSASPSGGRVVFSIERAIKGSPSRIDTFVWNISPSRQIAAYREEPDLSLTRDWIGENLLVTTNATDGSRTVVDALTGKATGDPAPASPGPYVIAGDELLAVDSSRLVVLNGEEGATVTQFSNEFLDGPTPLRRPIRVTAKLPVTATPPTTPLTTTTTPSSSAGPLTPNGNDVAAAAADEPIDGPTVQWAVTGILAGLIIVAIALAVSRRMDSE
ncbi:MAG: hypothetical protein IH940_12350 [Acidobacteria bacterium]|nr:hypothetical protein [Acidobacteriota bacterium]